MVECGSRRGGRDGEIHYWQAASNPARGPRPRRVKIPGRWGPPARKKSTAPCNESVVLLAALGELANGQRMRCTFLREAALQSRITEIFQEFWGIDPSLARHLLGGRRGAAIGSGGATRAQRLAEVTEPTVSPLPPNPSLADQLAVRQLVRFLSRPLGCLPNY